MVLGGLGYVAILFVAARKFIDDLQRDYCCMTGNGNIGSMNICGRQFSIVRELRKPMCVIDQHLLNEVCGHHIARDCTVAICCGFLILNFQMPVTVLHQRNGEVSLTLLARAAKLRS